MNNEGNADNGVSLELSVVFFLKLEFLIRCSRSGEILRITKLEPNIVKIRDFAWN